MMAVMPALPPRLLPVLYLALAHVALALAFAAVAQDPRGVGGFFYHPRMLAIVHLVTLGWITASILGSLYLVGPIALRVWLPAGWLDYVACALVSIGIAGMAAQFWLQGSGGVGWSGIAVASGIGTVAGRHARRLVAAPIPSAVRVHIVLAFVNMGLAAAMGVLIGFHKVHPFLPGFVLTNVYNRRAPGVMSVGAPVIYEAAFRYR